MPTKGLALTGLALSLLCVASAQALAENATVKAEDSLRAEPVATAEAIGKVGANTKVEIVERKGFWAKVKSGASQGWLKLSALSLETGGSGGGVSALAGLASGRTGGGNIVSASGTRGLSSEELKAARPDPKALAVVRSFAVDAKSAQDFGQQGGLSARQVQYIVMSPPAQQGANPGN